MNKRIGVVLAASAALVLPAATGGSQEWQLRRATRTEAS